MKSLVNCLLFCVVWTTIFNQNQLLHNSNIDNTERSANAITTPNGFIENKGQFYDSRGNQANYVIAKAGLQNMDLYVTEKGLTFHFFDAEDDDEQEHGKLIGSLKKMFTKKRPKSIRVDMLLDGANLNTFNFYDEIIDQGILNYYIDNNVGAIEGVKTFKKIIFKNVYNNIDWVLKFNSEGKLKYDFIVHSGGNPSDIKLLYEGFGTFIPNVANLSFSNELGIVSDGGLVSYSEGHIINSSFNWQENQTPLFSGCGIDNSTPVGNNANVFSYMISINVGSYNLSEDLVIDPILLWGSFAGGNVYDDPIGIEKDASGNMIIAGYSTSTNFPVTALAGAYNDATLSGGDNIIVSRFSNVGVKQWATYYGTATAGTQQWAQGLAIDNAGFIYVTGFSTHNGAAFLLSRAGAYNQAYAGFVDAFLLRFSSTGVLTWSTFIGGATAGGDYAYSVATGPNNDVFVVGITGGIDYPLVNPGGGAYFDNVFDASNFGGSSPSGFFAGTITKFNASGVMVWSTLYEGTNGENQIFDVDIDNNGDVVVLGFTGANNLPTFSNGVNYLQSGTANGANPDYFVVKFSSVGVRLFATNLGGGDIENSLGTILCDANNNIYVLAKTASDNFPVQAWNAESYFQGVPYFTSTTDMVLVRFSPLGVMEWSTYIGGTGNEYATSTDNLAFTTCGDLYLSFGSKGTHASLLINPGCSSWFDNTYAGSFEDDVLLKFSKSGKILFGSYVGGGQVDYRGVLEVDANNNLFVVVEGKSYGTTTGLPLLNLAGAYNDATGNTDDDWIIVKLKPIVPTLTVTKVDCSAGTCNGSATATVNCFESNVDYVWSNGTQALDNAFNSNTITGLCGGTYTIDVTAECNIPLSGSVTINNCPTGLPVSFLGAQINCTDNVKNLIWRTDSEQNNAYFSIFVMRSKTVSGQWEKITEIEGSYTSLIPQSYLFKIPNEYQNFPYFKITQTDLDGNEKELEILYNEKLCTNNEINIYPTVTSDYFFVDAGSEKCTIFIYDESGREVKVIQNHESLLPIDIKELSFGVYFCHIDVESQTKVFKIIKR